MMLSFHEASQVTYMTNINPYRWNGHKFLIEKKFISSRGHGKHGLKKGTKTQIYFMLLLKFKRFLLIFSFIINWLSALLKNIFKKYINYSTDLIIKASRLIWMSFLLGRVDIGQFREQRYTGLMEPFLRNYNQYCYVFMSGHQYDGTNSFTSRANCRRLLLQILYQEGNLPRVICRRLAYLRKRLILNH